jgi:hypothetical protein
VGAHCPGKVYGKIGAFRILYRHLDRARLIVKPDDAAIAKSASGYSQRLLSGAGSDAPPVCLAILANGDDVTLVK